MPSSISFLPLLLLPAVLPARAAVVQETVASVNGQPILLGEYQKEVEAMIENWRRSAPGLFGDQAAVAELKRKVLDQLVDNILIQQDAEKRKIKIHDRELENGIAEIKDRSFRRDEGGKALSDDEVNAALDRELKKEGVTQEQFRDRIRKQLMIRRVIDEVVKPKVKPPVEAEVKATFEKFQYIVKGDTGPVAGMPEDDAQAYVSLGMRIKDLNAERIRLSHILVKLPPKASMVEKTQALKKAQKLRKGIVEGGADFTEVARKDSDDPDSGPRGGDLGFIVRGYMPPEFEKVAFTTGVGDVSEPVETEFGYHLIRVAEKKAAESVTYEKLKDDLVQFLMQMRAQQELEKFVKGLRERGHVEVNLPRESKEPEKKDN